MQFSFLAVIVALTASMSVSACSQYKGPCNVNTDCCANRGLSCAQTQVEIVCFVSRLHLMTRLFRCVKSETGQSLP
ncbi:hypothetical protein DFJ58DRAFT_819745 [Suillus subalutaceus]|uniref:uncharacterized protein n=1 Tax=Suillus subalutaceus TaxID=48586 RepID=UPI001B874510|nr:uncharacterized protein DFJ58DRAFT_819745 [Suillus subalutaceus]KAG1836041.1 hypothetical protein DFJ58DRAFT_819745 [Suillus subalutaceus]